MSRNGNRIGKLLVVGSLMTLSFGAGMVVMGIFAAAVAVPIMATGVTMAVGSAAAAGATMTVVALYQGDSEQRLDVLIALQEWFDQSADQEITPEAVEYWEPALRQCLTDLDPEVVRRAEELLEQLEGKSTQEPSAAPVEL